MDECSLPVREAVGKDMEFVEEKDGSCRKGGAANEGAEARPVGLGIDHRNCTALRSIKVAKQGTGVCNRRRILMTRVTRM